MTGFASWRVGAQARGPGPQGEETIMRAHRRLVSVAAAMTLCSIVVGVSGAEAQNQSVFDAEVRFEFQDEYLQRCTISGTEGDDILRGTPGPDVICGFGGDDQLFGLEGDDILDGGNGDDRLYGAAGNDYIVGAGGDDLAYGGTGDDDIVGTNFSRTDGFETGQDRFIGGDGNDVIAGGWYIGTFFFRSGDDNGGARLFGGAGADAIFGTDGDDTIYVGPGGGIAYGYDGDDRLIGGKADGGPGVGGQYCDRSVPDGLGGASGAGTNLLNGGNGNDTLASGGGVSCMVGGNGSDRIYGSELDDVIWAGGSDQIPDGGVRIPTGRSEDRDRIYAKGGDDVILGSAGSELVFAAGGDDIFAAVFRFGENNGDDQIRLGDGNDIAVTGDGDDSIVAGPGADDISGGSGNDRLWPGRDGDVDVVDGEDGTDSCGISAPDATPTDCENIFRFDP